MVTALEAQEQLEQIDVQILSLLEDRVKVYNSMNLGEDEPEVIAETIAMWVEEAGERALDEDLVEKIVKAVIMLAKREED